MPDNPIAAREEEQPSRQQALAKRVCHRASADPNHQTHNAAVSRAAHAVHAEPVCSTSQSAQPAAAAARCVLALCRIDDDCIEHLLQ